ncbi:MAG: sensor histidine kinase [Flavobacteriales bacterium]
MKRSLINTIIVIITFALIGLIAVQIYWIDNAYKLREDRFGQKVNDALQKVSMSLEENKALKTLQSFDEIKKKLQSHPWFESDINITKKDSDHISYFQGGSYKNGSQDLKKEQDSTLEKNIPEGIKFFKDSIISNNNYDSNKKIKAIIEEKINKFENIEDSLETHFSKNKKGFEQIGKSFSIAAKFMKSIFYSNPLKNFKDHLSKEHIRSAIDKELRNKGITADFNYAILNNEDETVLHNFNNGEKAKKRTDDTKFMVQLFPHDMLSPDSSLRLYFPNKEEYLLSTMWIILLSSGVLILIIILAFTFTIQTIFKQKKLSEIKNDLIGNMTHELKTPISTISLASEALSDPDVSGNEKRKNRFVGMIKDENKRLGVLVENVLRTAILDKGEVKLNKEELDIHEILNEVMKNINIRVEQKNGKLNRELNAEDPVIKGDKIHITNLFYNLIDNALKYTHENPEITVQTKNEELRLRIDIIDNGIGIQKKDLDKVFDRLYRVSSGNIHEVKGTGLGLSYVKNITEKHGGKVDVKSKHGEGSRFIIYLPNNEPAFNAVD